MKLFEVHYDEDENEVYITFKKGYNNLYPSTQVKILREAIEEIHCYIKIMTEKEAEQTGYIHKYTEPK